MYTITINGTEELMKKFEAIQSNFGTSVDGVMKEVASDLRDTMENNAPVFTGRLKSSIEVTKGDQKYSYVIGPSADDGSRFPPSKYGEFVDTGGGPSGMPNVDDIGDRLGLSDREAFAFAKYLKLTGKAIRTPTFFVKKVALIAEKVLMDKIQSLLSKITSK